jgi:DNA-binding transcriptional regulator YdaS (Cro superfamily)
VAASAADLEGPVTADLAIDTTLLDAFERDLDLRSPEKGPTRAKVLGYGEISTVIAIPSPDLAHLALKRMPMFQDAAEAASYEALYAEYIDLLEAPIGVHVVPSRTVRLGRHRGKIVMYIVQERLPPERVAQRLVPALSIAGLAALARSALVEAGKVYTFNAERAAQIEVAVDGQISNWALRDASDIARLERGETVPLDYLDTSTPLLRKGGCEQLNTELFLRSAPSFLVPLLRAFIVKDVVNRYYDFRRVAVDMVANLYKEQRADAVGPLVQTVNVFFAEAFPRIAPISEQEVDDYYRADALIWRVYLAARKLDRLLHRLFARDYPYILPARVRR